MLDQRGRRWTNIKTASCFYWTNRSRWPCSPNCDQVVEYVDPRFDSIVGISPTQFFSTLASLRYSDIGLSHNEIIYFTIYDCLICSVPCLSTSMLVSLCILWARLFKIVPSDKNCEYQHACCIKNQPSEQEMSTQRLIISGPSFGDYVPLLSHWFNVAGSVYSLPVLWSRHPLIAWGYWDDCY